MDEADRAEAQEQKWRDLSIAKARSHHTHKVVVTHCQNCGEALPAPTADVRSRWCDADCRDDWQKRQP